MTPARSLRPARRGWIALAAVAVVVALLAAVDTALKRAPHAGFVLPDADLAVSSPDFPRVWSEFEASDAFARIQSEAPEVYHRLGVYLRRSTGIRWTPLRWYAWFGRPVSVSVSSGGWVMSCKPGLLLRLAAAGGAAGPNAWRDGFLIIGESRRLVTELANRGVQADSVSRSDSVRVGWSGPHPGDAVVQFAGAWSVAGSIAIEESAEGGEPGTARRVDDWPGTPVVTVFASRQALIDELLPKEWPEFPMNVELRRAWDDFRWRLPRDWSQPDDAVQFALVSVDTRDVIPVPELGALVRSSRGFEPLVPPKGALPYQWGVTAGWMAPWLGETVSLYAAGSDRVRAFANQERTMAALLDAPLPGRIASYDARLRLDFGQFADFAKSVTLTAAEQELLPAYSRDDVQLDLFPLFTALGALGVLELEGRQVGAQLEFNGRFTPPIDGEAGG
jgi:hypothetical protein